MTQDHVNVKLALWRALDNANSTRKVCRLDDAVRNVQASAQALAELASGQPLVDCPALLRACGLRVPAKRKPRDPGAWERRFAASLRRLRGPRVRPLNVRHLRACGRDWALDALAGAMCPAGEDPRSLAESAAVDMAAGLVEPGQSVECAADHVFDGMCKALDRAEAKAAKAKAREQAKQAKAQAKAQAQAPALVLAQAQAK